MPFIETALFGDDEAEAILHCAGFNIRVNGTGTLRSTLKGLDSVTTATLSTLTMATSPGREPTVLANFKSQRTLLRLETTSIDEIFNINRIVLFLKPLWSQFPA